MPLNQTDTAMPANLEITITGPSGTKHQKTTVIDGQPVQITTTVGPAISKAKQMAEDFFAQLENIKRLRQS